LKGTERAVVEKASGAKAKNSTKLSNSTVVECPQKKTKKGKLGKKDLSNKVGKGKKEKSYTPHTKA